jgi:Na+-translocating ferredoxin:NAD+ oxidoreductase RnfE subunit
MENESVSMQRTVWWQFIRIMVMVFLIIGIVTASLNLTFGSFTPIMWFLLSFIALLIAICNEAVRIADFLESKK